jgi:hypothetical protein
MAAPIPEFAPVTSARWPASTELPVFLLSTIPLQKGSAV